MVTRRFLLILPLALAGTWQARAAAAADAAAAFIDQTGKDLLAIINGTDDLPHKQSALQTVVDRVVDVEAVAQFCLGRFWRTATPDQRQGYLQAFHRVLLKNITGKLGEFQGVTFVIGRSVPRDADTGVASVITRPNAAPANVEWVVSTASGSPRIVDVVAEGTSLRVTQRSDYASFLNQHGGNVDELIGAMKKQSEGG